MVLSSPIDVLLFLPYPLSSYAQHEEDTMTNDYFVVNPASDTSIAAASASTRAHGGGSGAPQKIALTLANLPRRRDNAGATWPRTPSKIDPQVSYTLFLITHLRTV
jgi:hypothetical protein